MSPDMNSFMDACKYALLFVWQGLGGVSRLEWIVMVGLFVIFLRIDMGIPALGNAICSELRLIRKALEEEGARHDR
jgi:hypothetical protein